MPSDIAVTTKAVMVFQEHSLFPWLTVAAVAPPVQGEEAPPTPILLVAVGALTAVVVEAVKLAEDRSGDVIVRLYEAHGGRAAATLSTAFDFAAVVETDLLEREGDAVAVRGVEGRELHLQLRAFQLVTLRFRDPALPSAQPE